jgi:hypothetical protein
VPRPITNFGTGPGFARYQLGAQEELQIQALSFLADVIAGGPTNDDDIWVDYRNPAGQIIYRQFVDELHQPPSFYSLAAGAESFSSNLNGIGYWPQTQAGNRESYMTQRLSPLVLTTGCTVNIYASLGFPTPPDDPMASLDPTYVFTAHMWVEDARGLGDLPDVGNAILLGISA